MQGDFMLSAVTRALTAYFGATLAVYNERSVQNTAGEFLFVQELNREQRPDNYQHYNRFYFFNIRYHPDQRKKTQHHKTAEIQEALMECLLYIDTQQTPIRAASMRSEVQDGVLHFFVEYPVRVLRRPPPDPRMETLDLDEKIKE